MFHVRWSWALVSMSCVAFAGCSSGGERLPFVTTPELGTTSAALDDLEEGGSDCSIYANAGIGFEPIEGTPNETPMKNAANAMCVEARNFYADSTRVYVFDGTQSWRGFWCTQNGTPVIALSRSLFDGDLAQLKRTMGHEVLHTLVGRPPAGSFDAAGDHNAVFSAWGDSCAGTTGCVDASAWSQYGLSWSCTPPPPSSPPPGGGGGGDPPAGGGGGGAWDCGYHGPCYAGQMVTEMECEGWCGGEWDTYGGSCKGEITCYLME